MNTSWFGELNAFAAGEAEDMARKRKAAALSAELGALYSEVRALRESGRPDPERLAAILRSLAGHPSDWLLATELRELSEEGIGV